MDQPLLARDLVDGVAHRLGEPWVVGRRHSRVPSDVVLIRGEPRRSGDLADGVEGEVSELRAGGCRFRRLAIPQAGRSTLHSE
eukprot:5054053-Heterocapsa_arctica.AAC.1